MALHIDENDILQPLGIKILRGAEVIRNTREYTDTIPGRDGQMYFGSEFEAGLISLPCFVKTTLEEWDDKEAEIMGYLNPKRGVQELTFARKPEKVYEVVYAGQLRIIEEGPGYRKFTIPLKVFNPIIKSSTESVLAGSGTAENKGNVETPFIVEIVGHVTNPVVLVNGFEMEYTGLVAASDTLIIDTGKMTCTFNGVNALANYNGVFLKLGVGLNFIICPSGTTIKWLDNWT